MHLFCLRCFKRYYIPYFIMKHITYAEYSYCDDCYKQKEGKSRSFVAKVFTKNKNSWSKGVKYGKIIGAANRYIKTATRIC